MWIILASFIGNAMLYGIIYTDKKLQVHPMKLFATVAFLDGALFWFYLAEPYLCPLNDPNLFYLATFP